VQTAIRILLADDHPVVRQGLALILDNEVDMAVVGQAADGWQALALFRQQQPDVVLLDLRMPVMGGVEATAALLAEFPSARIVLLTTYDGEEDIYQGLRAGAKAYLLKDAPCEEILEAIRAVFAGQKYIPLHVGAKLAERMEGQPLGEREVEVLRLMAEGKSNQEIGEALHITEHTVKFHINHILGKLGVTNRTQAVLAALKRGIARL
jgi:DNA-binding NarL/FixJ family response regulator